MNDQRNITPSSKTSLERPLLQINRLTYVKLNTRVLEATVEKLKQYLKFATVNMNTEITNDDVVEYALNHLFERDPAFKSWLKIKT
jgi:anaerobic ribonucleoside-triphosphate reductase